jgi:poly(A) polymerase
MDKALAIQKEVQRILQTDEVYLVGGSVRDLVMGNTPKDYDFTTPLLPEVMEERIAAAGRHVYGIGKKFGTIGFKVPYTELVNVEYHADEVNEEFYSERVEYEYVEVTTFRSEVYTNKSRKPEVQFVPSLDEDLARRDFTMNAMVLKADGKIYDPYGGRLDIHAKQIKTVGAPKDRIQEDPLRMLRAARFAARYDFTIDPNFIGKARQLADRIYDVSVERWVQELDKLLTSTFTYWGFHNLHEMRLLQRILPELYTDESHINPFDCTRSRKTYESADLAWKFLLYNINIPYEYNKRDNVRLVRYINTGICARLKFSNDRTRIVCP